MTNKEAIRVLKSTSVNLGRIGGKIAFVEALEMAITALQELDKNPTKPNNSNDEVNNLTATQSNGIESKVKGLTACRVPEDDCISRRAFMSHIESEYRKWGEEYDAYQVLSDLDDFPSAQPERLTDDDFETIRIHLNAHKEKLCNQKRWKEAEEYQRIIDRFMAFASAQPETCGTCKHGYFGDKQCNDCRVRFTSHYERRNDGSD